MRPKDDDESLPSDLRFWRAPGVSPQVERGLREDFRRVHRRRTRTLWAGRAAVAALVLFAVALARWGRGPTRVHDRVDMDLAAYQPLPRLRLVRLQEARTEFPLEGFQVMRKMKLTKWSEGGMR
jgi:hypothetical protein